jgi:sRNA-binding protein
LREQANGLLERLIEVYPAAFFPVSERQIRPLKLGIHKDLTQIVKDWGYDRVVLRYTLGGYTRRLRYQLALLNSPHRVDLAGNAAGEITAEHRQIAQDKVALIREKRKQQSRQAATSDPAVPSEPPAAEPAKPPEPTVSTTPPLAACANPDDPASPASPASATDPTPRSRFTKPRRQSPPRSQPPARPQPSGRRYRDNPPPRPVSPAVPPAPPPATAPSRTGGGISAEAIAALQQKLSTKARL